MERLAMTSPAAYPKLSHSDSQTDLPITKGSLLDFPSNPIEVLRKLHGEHGELAALQDGVHRLFFVFGPKWTQHVLSDAQTFHSRFFALRGGKRSPQRRLTSGLLSMNGNEHKQHRRLVMGPFQKQVIGQYAEPVTQLVTEMLDTWQVGETRDLHEDMTHYMLRVTSALLFGLDEPELAYQIGEMLDDWIHMNHEIGMGAFIAGKQFTDGYDELMTLGKTLEEEILGMINLKKSRGATGGDLLSLLIQAHDQGVKIDDGNLVGHVALLFGAAHKTTAHTLCWTIFLLTQHPEIMSELWQEIDTLIEQPSPSLDEIENLSVTERVLKESMRIMPASGYSQRIAAEPVDLGPFSLRRGEPVIFSQFITQRLPEIYRDPDAFLPDRWRTLSVSPYAYLPFGNGPRMCIGAPLAMMILKITLPTMLKRFRFSAVSNSDVNGAIRSTMLTPLGQLPVKLHEPDGQFDQNAVQGNIHDLVKLPARPQTAVEPSRKAA